VTRREVDSWLAFRSCAHLSCGTGTGQVWTSGLMATAEGAPRAQEHATHALRSAHEAVVALSQPPGKQVVRDPFEPRWDLYIWLGGDGAGGSAVGLGIVCAILALALDRPLPAGTLIAGVSW
jgi:hypothetical protein